METTRIKWDKGILTKFYAAYGDVKSAVSDTAAAGKAESPVYDSSPEAEDETKQEPTSEPEPEPEPEQESKADEFFEISDDEWRDFVNDIDWAMM